MPFPPAPNWGRQHTVYCYVFGGSCSTSLRFTYTDSRPGVAPADLALLRKAGWTIAERRLGDPPGERWICPAHSALFARAMAARTPAAAPRLTLPRAAGRVALAVAFAVSHPCALARSAAGRWRSVSPVRKRT